MSRPRTVLTTFIFCAIPLLLLAALNYWNGIRAVDSTLSSVVQNDLNSFNVAIDEELRERKSDVLKLSMSSQMQSVVSDKERVDVIPQGLFLTLNELPPLKEFRSFTVFNRDRRPFGFRDDDGRWHVPEHFPLMQLAQPDARVWELQGNVALENPNSSTASIEYSAPIHDQTGTLNIGAVIGVVQLQDVFANASRGLRSKSGREFAVALDQSGKMLYHSDPLLRSVSAEEALPGFNRIASATNNGSGVGRFESATGSYLVAYSPIPSLNVIVAVGRPRSEGVWSAHKWGIGGLVIALLAAVAAAFLVEKHVQRRTKGIARVKEDVSAIAKGELDRRIILQSSDDARVLADNINVVTERLRAQIAREEESRQFESFIRISAMLTHDLKNAIEGLSLTVANMERHFDNPQFRTDALKGLTSATDKLKALVARLARPLTSLSGEHKRPTNMDLVPVIQRVLAMTAERAGNQHTIVTRLPPNLYALVDAVRIEEVLENLVLNALEAMHEKSGTLTIEAGHTSNGAPMISVSDTGRGMTRQFMETRMFRPFATTKKTGIGLGLYTCREVITASGGSIEVDSVEGAGTTFRVVLPSASHDRRNQ
jgi:signal transduction histidine kinase